MHKKTYTFIPIETCNMCGSNEFTTLGIRLSSSQGLNPKSKTGISVSVQKCSNCRLIFNNPLPIPESLQDHYGIPTEDYWDSEYLEIRPEYFNGMLQRFQNLVPFSSGQKILDIGTGIGKCMIACKQAGYDAYGIEPSVPFYQKGITETNLSGDRLLNLSIEEASFPENYFSIITFGAVLEHLYDPKAALEKAIRWVKPGGVIHVEIPSSNWLVAKIVNLFFWLRGTNYVTNTSPMHSPFHLYEFTEKSFKNIPGVEIAHVEYFGGYGFSKWEKLFHPFMKWTKTGMQLTVYLRKK